MSRFDSIIPAEAWNRLVADYVQYREEGNESDRDFAELLVSTIYEVEGI